MERHFRWAGEGDHAQIADVMFDAVRNGASRYTDEQRAAWVPAPRSGPEWTRRLAVQEVVVAEAEGRMLGFMSLGEGGYVDFAYIRPEAQGSGLFRQLFQHILGRARETGQRRLWVHASLMAEPAFAKLGFTVTTREQVAIGGETLERFEMEMPLTGS